jgi:hypothetical protein
MEKICDRCGKEYKDISNGILTMDYELCGRGKPIKMNLCMECIKEILEVLKLENSKISILQ